MKLNLFTFVWFVCATTTSPFSLAVTVGAVGFTWNSIFLETYARPRISPTLSPVAFGAVTDSPFVGTYVFG